MGGVGTNSSFNTGSHGGYGYFVQSPGCQDCTDVSKAGVMCVPEEELVPNRQHDEPNTTTPLLNTPIAASHPYQARPIFSKLEGRLVPDPLRGFASPERSRGVERQLPVEVRPRRQFLSFIIIQSSI